MGINMWAYFGGIYADAPSLAHRSAVTMFSNIKSQKSKNKKQNKKTTSHMQPNVSTVITAIMRYKVLGHGRRVCDLMEFLEISFLFG